MDGLINQNFAYIRPFCIHVLDEPSIQNAQELSNALCNVDRDSLQLLQEYILLPPLELINSSPSSKEIVFHCFRIIRSVISLTQVKSWNLFNRILLQITKTVGGAGDNLSAYVLGLSDELKLESVLCVTELLRQSAPSVLENLYSPAYGKHLGYAVYLLLLLSEENHSQEVRIGAMESLLSLSLSKRKELSSLRMCVSGRFSAFIPKISVTLATVIGGCGHQSHAITVAALNTWTYFVSLVFDDEQLIDVQTKKMESCTENNLAAENFIPTVQRTVEWQKSTSEKLGVLITSIAGVVTHSHWKVRLAVVKLAASLLKQCCRALYCSVPVLIDTLLILASDEYEEVREESRQALADSNEILKLKSINIVVILEESIHKLVIQLPRIVRTSDDAKKLSMLNLLYGYLCYLGHDVRQLLVSFQFMERFFQSLMQILEMNDNEIRLIAELSSLQDCGKILDSLHFNPPVRQRRQYKFFHEDKMESKIHELCKALGHYGDLQVFIDYLIDVFHESETYGLQALLLLNEIVLGSKHGFVNPFTKQSDDISDVHIKISVRAMTDEYVLPVNWNLKTTVDTENETGFDAGGRSLLILNSNFSQAEGFREIRRNILQVLLLLEGIGNCAKVLENEFMSLLVKVFYLILERVGDGCLLVSHTAYLTLLDVCNSCGYRSLPDMILQNSDYLLNSLCIKLRYMTRAESAPIVLKVALQYGDTRLIPLIVDVLDDIISGLDAHRENPVQAKIFLQVLYFVVTSISLWFPAHTNPLKESGRSSNVVKSTSLLEHILEYHNLKQISEGSFVDECDTFNEDDPPTSENHDHEASSMDNESHESQKEVPLHVLMIKKILEKCIHYISYGDPRVRLIVLDIVTVVILALQDWEDELLPLVHRLWTPFSLRFQDDKHFIQRQALNVLETLVNVCPDFVRRRILKEVWPKLLHFLESQASHSLGKKNSAYQFTVSYKYQDDILKRLGKMAVKLELPEVDCDNLMSVCILYLNANQPVQLQENAVELVKQLINWVPDLVWLKLNDIYSTVKELQPPNAPFKTIKVAGCNSGNKDYAKNVLTLMEFL